MTDQWQNCSTLTLRGSQPEAKVKGQQKRAHSAHREVLWVGSLLTPSHASTRVVGGDLQHSSRAVEVSSHASEGPVAAALGRRDRLQNNLTLPLCPPPADLLSPSAPSTRTQHRLTPQSRTFRLTLARAPATAYAVALLINPAIGQWPLTTAPNQESVHSRLDPTCTLPSSRPRRSPIRDRSQLPSTITSAYCPFRCPLEPLRLRHDPRPLAGHIRISTSRRAARFGCIACCSVIIPRILRCFEIFRAHFRLEYRPRRIAFAIVL